MKIIFFSDTHLNKKDDGKINVVENFIHNACEDADMVVILGDLFEFYHGYDGYIYPWYKNLADALKTITNKDKPVYLIEGNHEFDMGSYFESYTGIKCSKHLTIDIEGKKTFISHGDEISPFCLGKVLKSRFIYSVMDIFGPYITWKTAMGVSIFLSKKKKPYNDKAMLAFRKYAQRKFDEGYDVVILAHSHISDKIEYDAGGKNKVYLNTGDFIRHSTYIEYNSESGFKIKKYKFKE